MQVPGPRPTAFDVRFRLPGVAVRIHPLFWVSSALVGISVYGDPEAGGLGWFGFWIAAVLISLFLHELGHVAACRLFGVRGEVVLYSLGGLTIGIDALPRGQRLAVLVAGPVVSLLIVGGVYAITWLPSTEALLGPDWQPAILDGLRIVVLINLYWGLLNVLPLWPLDGGCLVCEIGEGLFGRTGRTTGLILCLVAATIFGGWVMVQMVWQDNFRYDPRYTLMMEHWAVVLLYSFLLWTRTFRALLPERATDLKR
jgi:Zn-dependent protease